MTDIAICRNCVAWIEVKNYKKFAKKHDNMELHWLDKRMKCCMKPDWDWDCNLKKKMKLPKGA
jgi:hypothetical protein